MAEHKRFDFRVVFTMSLCTLELKQKLICLLFQVAQQINCSSEKLFEADFQIWALYLTNSNTKVSAAKDHGENSMKVRPPLVHHVLCSRLLPGTHVIRYRMEALIVNTPDLEVTNLHINIYSSVVKHCLFAMQTSVSNEIE